jgi:hypothetical protein
MTQENVAVLTGAFDACTVQLKNALDTKLHSIYLVLITIMT